MAVIISTRCEKCDKLFPDVWTDEPHPRCCGAETKWTPTTLHTTEWGGPRHYPHIRDEPFGSRGELKAYAERNGMTLGASNEKVGGARNEEHMNLGKRYSYAGSPKS